MFFLLPNIFLNNNLM